jgi:Helicase associated domain
MGSNMKKKAPPSGSSSRRSSEHLSTAMIATTTSTAKPPPPPPSSTTKHVPTPKRNDDDDDNQEHWKTRYDELVRFKEQHGHLFPSPTLNRSLNLWVFRQRQAWAKHLNEGEERKQENDDKTFMAQRIELLIQLGLGSRHDGPRSTEELHAAASAAHTKKKLGRPRKNTF